MVVVSEDILPKTSGESTWSDNNAIYEAITRMDLSRDLLQIV
jgi:hypothetical protein